MPIIERFIPDKKKPWLFTKEIVWVCPRCNSIPGKLGGYETIHPDEAEIHALDHLLGDSKDEL